MCRYLARVYPSIHPLLLDGQLRQISLGQAPVVFGGPGLGIEVAGGKRGRQAGGRRPGGVAQVGRQGFLGAAVLVWLAPYVERLVG
jgi:hypothetical protein